MLLDQLLTVHLSPYSRQTGGWLNKARENHLSHLRSSHLGRSAVRQAGAALTISEAFDSSRLLSQVRSQARGHVKQLENR